MAKKKVIVPAKEQETPVISFEPEFVFRGYFMEDLGDEGLLFENEDEDEMIIKGVDAVNKALDTQVNGKPLRECDHLIIIECKQGKKGKLFEVSIETD